MATDPRAWQPGPAWLFCPADRPERYLKALAVADVVVLDLEDAVEPGGRSAARDGLRELANRGDLDLDRTVIRINGHGSNDHSADIALMRDLGARRVMLAKSEAPDHVVDLPHQVVVLVETPRGVLNVVDLARQHNVVAVMWGADDLVAGLGGTSSRFQRGPRQGTYRDVARHARSSALMAAKSFDRLAIDAVHMDIPDLDGLATQCEDAVASGFDAVPAIHPSQLAIIRAAYRPSAEQVDWARRLLTHVGDDRSVTTFDGAMVDGPIYRQAERVLALDASATRGDSP